MDRRPSQTDRSAPRLEGGGSDSFAALPRRPRPRPRRSSSAPRVRPRVSRIDRAARFVGAKIVEGIGEAATALHRWFRRCSRKTQVRVAVGALVVTIVSPVLMLNMAVSYFGQSVVFPLSPFFLKQKVSALASYAAHRPLCVLMGHPETSDVVARAEARERLPRGLLAAVIKTESAGRPHRISSAGAMGPGQLMPATARQMGVSDPFDSEDNIHGAARLLGEHLARFRKIRLAVAAYNAGPGAVRGRVPNNGETPAYVAKVMETYRELRPQPRRTRRL